MYALGPVNAIRDSSAESRSGKAERAQFGHSPSGTSIRIIPS